MTHLLHLDASARPDLAGKDTHGSHSRNLSQRFVSQWLTRRPQDSLTYRDIGQNPPSSTGSPRPLRRKSVRNTG